MNNMIISFIETISMTWIFFISISNAYWNKFWCYAHIWAGLKKVETIFRVLFGKMWWQPSKIPYFDTEYEHKFMQITFITWKWLNLKHTLHQHAFQYHWTIWNCFLKKINNVQSWTKLLRQTRKSIFPWKIPSPAKSMLLAKV